MENPQHMLGSLREQTGRRESHQGSQIWGSHAQFGELDHQRLEGHTWEKQVLIVLVLLLYSSLCTPYGPCWRQNLGLEGSFPHK